MEQTTYFEDYEIGASRTTFGRTITETEFVVHAGHTGHQALDGVVRAGHPREQLGGRQADGDQHAVEDVQGQDSGQAAERQQEFAAAEGRQAPETRQVDHADGRVDDERAQNRCGGARKQRAQEEQDREDGRAGHQ